MRGIGGEKESAGPGRFQAKAVRGRNDGKGRRGTPRRRITVALATAWDNRTLNMPKHGRSVTFMQFAHDFVDD